jgi:hypothetical protein
MRGLKLSPALEIRKLVLFMPGLRITAFALILVAALCGVRAHAQAALLMEEPYGVFGALNPTGHNAIYFQRICADTPVKVRRCLPGEQGAVIARYQGIDGYDWVAIPLLPYLYSVENAADVPERVTRKQVKRLRERYHEAHLLDLGAKLPAGNFFRGGWTQLVGVAYERRIYAFRFNTTAEQDDAVIAQLNEGANQSHFDLLYSNCADFSRELLNTYFPDTFKRSLLPDAGMTTPKQNAYALVHYGRAHPETDVRVLEIPQVPGYRRLSHANKSIDESFVTTIYAVPLAVFNPWLAGGLAVDYLVHFRHIIPKHPDVLGPDSLGALTSAGEHADNPAIAGVQVLGAASATPAASDAAAGAQSGLKEAKASQ